MRRPGFCEALICCGAEKFAHETSGANIRVKGWEDTAYMGEALPEQRGGNDLRSRDPCLNEQAVSSVSIDPNTVHGHRSTSMLCHFSRWAPLCYKPEIRVREWNSRFDAHEDTFGILDRTKGDSEQTGVVLTSILCDVRFNVK